MVIEKMPEDDELLDDESFLDDLDDLELDD
jgi:hypothetical protein